MNQEDFPGFNYRKLGRKGAVVSPIGIADTSFGKSGRPSFETYKYAFEKEINLFLWSPKFFNLTNLIKDLSPQQRAKLFIVAGSGGGLASGLHKKAEKYLKLLGVEKFSCFMLYWVRSEFRIRNSVISELTLMRDDGLCDNIGLSIHRRAFAHEIYERDIFDIFMLRYNAAHRGLERDFMEKLNPEKMPGIITYTATRWGELLKRPDDWTGPMPRPGDLYRFQLSNPRVTATWMAPSNIDELKDNLHVIAEGPLKCEEDESVRQFGDFIHSRKKPIFGNFFENSARI